MSDWPTQRLGDLVDIRVSNVDKKTKAGETSVRLCNYMDVYSNDYIHRDLPFMLASATAVEIARFKVEEGDVLLTKDSESPDDIGIAAVVDDDIDGLVCGYHLAQLKPQRDRVVPAFLAKQLNSSNAARYFAQRATGSTRYGLSNGTLAGLTFSLPPPSHQRAIAAVLRSVDGVISKTEELITKYQQIKSGLMHDLFTRGVLPSGELRPRHSEAQELYQETALGWLPRGWSVSDCGREFVIDSGITLGPHRRPGRKARPYLRVANVHRDELRLEDIAYLEELAGDADLSLKEKDLLVVEGHANRMEIGRCAMVTATAVDMLFQNHLFRLRPRRLISEFALDWLNSHHAQRYWDMTCSTSSGLNTINRKMLCRLPVLVPPADEQALIARASASAKSQIKGEVRLLDKLCRQKLGLMQDLLTGRVSVDNLVPELAGA